MNQHQQPSFKFETNIAKYECVYVDHIGGDVHWEVKVVYSSSEKLTATFIAPSNWSRTMLFQWLSDMELSEV